MISLEEFHQDFLQSILSDADSRGLMRSEAFFENVCEELTSTGDLTINYTLAEYIKNGIEVHGYDYDEERQILSVLVHQFFQENKLQTLTKKQIDIKFNRTKKFLGKCVEGFYKNMEETSEAYSMAYNIYNYYIKNKVSKIRLIILTDGKATRNLTELAPENLNGIYTEYRVIDINYLFKVYLSEYNNSKFDINLKIPSLQIPTVSEEYESYLTVIKGDELYEIYEEYGQKLFEQNVRTFLQFRGNVNKGIRNTIEYSPEMFFAYNNGITSTASDVELDKEGNIIKISNFQIVNGGQTTSAIYAAKKNSKLDVSKVSVQMKLSVVKDHQKQNDFVTKVSEYANTQNKVNKSDFFSNSPFHKEMKDYSKRIWVPAIGGSQRRTRWYYERVRGEYLNEQTYLSPSEKKQFKIENPKEQLLEKTFLAKSENAWMQKPDVVAKGAQYSFSVFADDTTSKLEKNNLAITERYFKDAIARVILFKTIEKSISKARWYDGGYRAQTVAYTISYLSREIENRNKYFNLNIIWEEQKCPDELIKIVEFISERVYLSITNPPSGYANPAQWCKQTKCWETIKNLDLNIKISDNLLLDEYEEKYNKKEEIKEKKLVNGIEMQMFVVTKEIEIWQNLYSHYVRYRSTSNLSTMQLDILKKMSQGLLQPPSEKQAKILYQLYQVANDEGILI